MGSEEAIVHVGFKLQRRTKLPETFPQL